MKCSRIPILVGVLLAFATSGTAAPIVFNTSDSQFDAGIDNQGWWSATQVATDNNDNYAAGGQFADDQYRNFFSFNLSTLNLSGLVITSAVLELARYGYLGDAGGEVYGLFDVSTDAATLNNNVGTSATIFNDLGTGTSYGTFQVNPYSTSNTLLLAFALNAAGIADITSAAGGFFSVGGRLLSFGPTAEEALFAFSSGSSGSGSIQRLVLNVEPAAAVVPEPTSLLLLGSGLAGVVARVRRRQKQIQ